MEGFDFEDVGAEVGAEFGRVVACDALAQVQHSDAVKRLQPFGEWYAWFGVCGVVWFVVWVTFGDSSSLPRGWGSGGGGWEVVRGGFPLSRE